MVKIEEPDDEKALLMMRGVAGLMEQHHQVLLLDEEEVKSSDTRPFTDTRIPPKKSKIEPYSLPQLVTLIR